MRRVVSVCLGALASLLVIGLSHATAEEAPTTTIATTTTTTPAVTVGPTTTTTGKSGTTTTTAKSSGSTTTAVVNGGNPIPPPAAGPTQTLVPDLLGTPLELATTSTSFAPFTPPIQGTLPTTVTAPISNSSDSPSGLTLVLAAIAWLASFGGLLVYVEEKRSSRWKHLAR